MRINLDIGEAWMEVKYAPTGRASCKGCKNKIEKGGLRLTNIEDEDHFHSEMHYHVDCFRLKPYFKETKYTDVFYIDELTQEDQELVKEQFAKLTKQVKGTTKKIKKDKQTKQKKDDKDSDSDFEMKQKETIPSLNKKKKDQVPIYFCQYDTKQIEEFRKIEAELKDKSIEQLKQMLKKNDQKQSGNKTELIQRIADAKILGCLGKCPSCFAGRPRLENQVFKCPGFMDDTEFKHCGKEWKSEELTRTPWQE